MTTNATHTTNETKAAGQKPDFVVKSTTGYGKNGRFRRVGAAWRREDGGLCVRLDGKQLVENDLHLFPATAEGGAQ